MFKFNQTTNFGLTEEQANKLAEENQNMTLDQAKETAQDAVNTLENPVTTSRINNIETTGRGTTNPNIKSDPQGTLRMLQQKHKQETASTIQQNPEKRNIIKNQ